MQIAKSFIWIKRFPRQWYKQFDKFTVEYDYNKSPYENCEYYMKHHDGSYIYMLLYINEMVTITRDMT